MVRATECVQAERNGIGNGNRAPGQKRLKVLIVLWRLTEGGGIQTVVRSILRHADPEAFEFHVCSVRPLAWDGHGDFGMSGALMHSLGLSGNLSMREAVRISLELAFLVRRLRPDVLHLHGGTAALGLPASLILRRCRKVLEIHDAPDSGRFSPRTVRAERWMGKYLAFRTVVHSADVRKGVARQWGVAEESIRLLPLGIETDIAPLPEPERSEVRRSLDVPEGLNLVLHVGRLVPEKRPDLFLRVACEVLGTQPDTRFVLVGGGPGTDGLRGLAEELGVSGKVIFAGFVENLRAVYAAADVFVSTSRYEGWGLAVAEAMAAGLPVVATRVGGVEDVVGQCGILVDTDDPVVIGQYVINLLRDPAWRSRLGADARQRAQEILDVRKSVAAFEDLYGRSCAAPLATIGS